MMSEFAMKSTCAECPWLLTSKPGKFPPERYLELADTCKPGGLHGLFACHMTPDGGERACAGMLTVCGMDSNRVRLAMIEGRFDPRTVKATGPLYPNYRAMAEANGCDPEAEEFEGLIDE
jgi:hypothetical protein